MRRVAYLWTCVLVLLLAGPARAQEFDARAYADRAIALVREHALASGRVDWDAATAELHRQAATARDSFDLYPGLVTLLDRLGDQHSFLQLSSERAAAYEAAKGRPFRAASDHPPLVERAFVGRSDTITADVRRGAARLRTIVVPAFSGRRAATEAFAGMLYRAVVRPGACGYALDFRGNTGGNMWPMFAGLAPLLGDGEFGAFVSAEGRERIFHRAGSVGIRPDNGEVQIVIALAGWQAQPALAAAPVAILIDGASGSSGEITPILFARRPHSRVFGTPSYGSTTSTEGYPLPDGANLVIATSAVADRTGHIYAGAITPDEIVRHVPGARDAQMEAALRWLAGQPGCRRR